MKSLNLQFLAFCLIVGLDHNLANNQVDKKCTAFEQMPGKIVDIDECPQIRALINKRKTQEQFTGREKDMLEYFRQNRFDRTVCCEFNYGLEQLKKCEETCGKFRIDPVVGGHVIKMGSRPWIALLEYNDTEIRFQCGATLITPRYLLTAAHCVNSNLTSARLGEHSISTEKDCKATGSDVWCLPPPQDIAIEGTIVHMHYETNRFTYDIALLRLKTPVSITEYVRTICLPLYEDVQKSIQISNNGLVTGWGMTLSKTNLSDEPNEAIISRQPDIDCQRSRTEQILENQLCFIALGRDSCSGDSGGPLSYYHIYKGSQRLVQLGIISYGLGDCGSGKTAVYTDVISFLPWITQNIEP